MTLVIETSGLTKRYRRVTALLAAFTAMMIVTGLQMAAQWHSALSACATAGAGACPGGLPGTLSLGSHAVGFLVIMTLGVPAVLGILLGAPLLAYEMETGATGFAWTQSITRTRWLAVKAGWLLLAAAVLGGAVSVLVTWWEGPDNALQADAFQTGRFDIMGTVPVGYSLFAMALGIAAGALIQRTLPAIAATLALFITARALITFLVRPHLLAPVTRYFPIGVQTVPLGPIWQLTAGFVTGAGQPISLPQGTSSQVITGLGGRGLPVNLLPAACQALAGTGSGGARPSPVASQAVTACAREHGIREYLTYQPADRFWAFQGIETGIFVVLAAVLLAVAFWVLKRRDA
jgi:hypothetical protein